MLLVASHRALIAVVAGLATLAVLIGPTARPAAQGPPLGGNLTGQLLVASEEMADPRFARTVLYMVQHGADGAQGLVLNRPLGELPLVTLLAQLGMPTEGATGTVRLHSGGPVDPLRLCVLHTAEYSIEGTAPLRDGLAITLQPEILRDIAGGKGPRRRLLIVGYAGWAPGQLEAEMKAGYWVRAQADEALVFDEEYRSKWERASARRKIDL